MKFWTHSSKKLVTKAALFSNTNTKKRQKLQVTTAHFKKSGRKVYRFSNCSNIYQFLQLWKLQASFFCFRVRYIRVLMLLNPPPFPPPPPFFSPPVTTCHAKWVHVPKWHRISIQAIELCPFSNQARVQRGKWWSKTKQVLNSVKRTQEM